MLYTEPLEVVRLSQSYSKINSSLRGRECVCSILGTPWMANEHYQSYIFMKVQWYCEGPYIL